MDNPTTYLQWGFILISLPNLILLLLMVVLFILALVAPFPGHRSSDQNERSR